jgi:hypothetical protein
MYKNISKKETFSEQKIHNCNSNYSMQQLEFYMSSSESLSPPRPVGSPSTSVGTRTVSLAAALAMLTLAGSRHFSSNPCRANTCANSIRISGVWRTSRALSMHRGINGFKKPTLKLSEKSWTGLPDSTCWLNCS